MDSSTNSPAMVLPRFFGPFRVKRLIVALFLLGLAIAPGTLGELTRGLMVDAFVQVSAFVAATLLLFYGSERVFHFDIGQSLKTARHWQIPIATLLGATPGCGGAVVVVAAYTSGNVSFGGVVAALTATMGDAAFLLIATRPDVAMVVLPLGLVVGALSGWTVDWVGGKKLEVNTAQQCALAPLVGRTRTKDYIFLALAAPGLVIGVTQVLGADIYAIYGNIATVVGLTGTAIGLAIWATSHLTAMTNSKDSPITRMAEETSFIAIWVIGAYLAYDYLVTFTGVDLHAAFSTVGPLLPLMAIVIGMIPGCGPQILVTTAYVNGLIPFAALMGNAISNDGDALFPALAINPKAAIWATVYSTIPAMITAYGFYFFAPGFMN
ncbi:putative manganese transporter [Yoonia sp.]|uniref:putative manganese transporter n=1 Tax=Yoonia sp. TaxID=2212373 RepID=UPI0019DB2899|nr:putative manganese transporter [Yoonia sp.]MBE0414237.1 arsenic efflux protein [Yoonia sp.]